MSNPWAEVYKNLRSEILDESDLQERRKLRGDVKTTATQTRYDLKSRVAKMRAQGKTDLEIKQYLDKYIANSNLPGEQKAQIRQVALSAGYEPEGKEQLSENPLAVGAALGIGVGGAYLAKKAYNVAKQMRKNKEDAMKRASGESYDLEGNQLQEEPGDGYLGPARLKIKNPLASDATRAAGDQRRRQQTNAAVNSGQRPTLGGSGSYANQFDAMREKLRNSYEPEGEQLNELPIVPLAIGAGALAAPYLAKRFLKPAADKALDKATNDPNRRLVTGGTVGDLNKAKGLSNSYQPEGEIIDERRRAEKGTPRKPRDKAFELVSKMMGSGRLGMQPRGVKKDKGAPTPGPSMTPAQKVAKRRADAQRAQDMMHSRYD